jgi:hypothetical protein
MHAGSLDRLAHPHVCLGAPQARNELRTRFMVSLLFSMQQC